MPSIHINFIALISPGADGTRVIFPRARHRLEVFRGSQQLPAGQRMKIIARDAGGAEVDLGGPESPQVGGRVFSIRRITGRNVQPKPEAELLAGPAQAILVISGGRFIPGVAIKAEQYTESDWDFEGTNHTQKLTDSVAWKPTRPDLRYFLRDLDTGAEEALGEDDVLSFSNRDDDGRAVDADPDGRVRIREVDSIYDLVTPDGARPIPATDERPANDPGWVQPQRIPGDPAGTFENPERPLCPVGEP